MLPQLLPLDIAVAGFGVQENEVFFGTFAASFLHHG
jgi:hypothetical protein